MAHACQIMLWDDKGKCIELVIVNWSFLYSLKREWHRESYLTNAFENQFF